MLCLNLSTFTPFSVRSLPSYMICPEVGTSSRLSDLKNVDLPQPEGPIMAITSPLVIVVLMSLSTPWSPNVFIRFITSRIPLESFLAS